MPSAKPQRIMSFAEFTRSPRTDLEIASYHGCLEALRRMGLVDDDLNIMDPPKVTRDE